MSDVVMYDLAPSPNNMKIRIALNYKGVPFQRVPVDMQDRQQLVEVSGQPLAPVLQHGESVVFDSGAILRYVDATFAGPKLFFADRDKMREGEELERWVRANLGQPVGMVFGELMKVMGGGEPDLDVCKQASALAHELSGKLESKLAESPWLLGDEMSFVDVTAAPTLFYTVTPDAAVSAMPMLKIFQDNLHLGPDRDRTRDWIGRVMAYDR